MRKVKLRLDQYELGLIIKVLVEYRNKIISEGGYTDTVDDVLLKLCK